MFNMLLFIIYIIAILVYLNNLKFLTKKLNNYYYY
jgi:hypothetical protein